MRQRRTPILTIRLYCHIETFLSFLIVFCQGKLSECQRIGKIESCGHPLKRLNTFIQTVLYERIVFQSIFFFRPY